MHIVNYFIHWSVEDLSEMVLKIKTHTPEEWSLKLLVYLLQREAYFLLSDRHGEKQNDAKVALFKAGEYKWSFHGMPIFERLIWPLGSG